MIFLHFYGMSLGFLLSLRDNIDRCVHAISWCMFSFETRVCIRVINESDLWVSSLH